MSGFEAWAPVAGAVVGGLLSRGGSRQGGTVNQTSQSEPWGPSQEYLLDIFKRGQGLLGPGSPYTQEAQTMQANIARSPMQLVPGAQAELAKTIRGDYLDVANNPYLQNAGNAVMNRSIAAMSPRFSGEAYGASPSREWLQRVGTESIAPMYFGAYSDERGRQMQSLGMAPGLETASYIPSQQLYAAGETPWLELARMRGLLTGTPGGQTSSQTPYFENPWASMLGGAMGGMQLGKDIQKNLPPGWGGQSPAPTPPYEPDYGVPYGSPGSIYE